MITCKECNFWRYIISDGDNLRWGVCKKSEEILSEAMVINLESVELAEPHNLVNVKDFETIENFGCIIGKKNEE